MMAENKDTEPTQGVVFFAYNTEQIDYVKLAFLAARYVKRYMDQPVCLITDEGSWNWLQQSQPEEIVNQVIDDVVIAEANHPDNPRVHHDSPWTQFTSQFKNSNKHQVINYTPYDRTLLMDIDYIVQNNSLNQVFESDDSVLLFHNAVTLANQAPLGPERFLKPMGIPMVWSTVVYFDKRSEFSRLFFDLWAHISDNYEFYRFLYGFTGKLFRTDFCVSIALHILNGMNSGDVVGALPGGNMIYMSQRDELVKINGADDWVYLVNDRNENWKDVAARIQGENVHVMNKRAIERHFNEIMEALK